MERIKPKKLPPKQLDLEEVEVVRPAEDYGETILPTAKIEHLVLLIHGASTWGEWTSKLRSNGLQSGIRIVNCEHVRVPGVRDLWKGDAKIFANYIAEVYNLVIEENPGAKVSIYAYSFGSHTVVELVKRNQLKVKKFHAIVFIGSIVKPEHTPLLKRKCKILVNDCGTKDIAVLFAEAFRKPHYSATGNSGFRNSIVKDRYFSFGHSGGTLEEHFNSYVLDIFGPREFVLEGPLIDPRVLPPQTPKLLFWGLILLVLALAIVGYQSIWLLLLLILVVVISIIFFSQNSS